MLTKPLKLGIFLIRPLLSDENMIPVRSNVRPWRRSTEAGDKVTETLNRLLSKTATAWRIEF